MKKAAIQIFKFLFAVGLIFWLIKTEKITMEPFVKMISIPWLIPVMFALMFVVIAVNNYRWMLLLRGQKIETSQKQTLPLTFIGLFFNLAMPGSVGGDVIKAWYIAKDQPGTKLRAATSVLMDRIVGLFAMAMIALVAVLTHWSEMMAVHQFHLLALMISGLVLGFLVFFALGYSSRVKSHPLTTGILDRIPLGGMLTRLYDAIHSFREGRREFLIGILLSLAVQSLNILAFWLIAVELDFPKVTLGSFFFIIPVGTIATAVPISPAGLGVGQAVFAALFTWYQGASTGLGPALITVFQVIQAIWSLLGAYFYFTRQNPPMLNGSVTPVSLA